MCKLLSFACLALSLAGIQGSTLQQLTLDEMIQKSTTIVHGQVQKTGSAFRGAMIYTHYRVQASEVLKGSTVVPLDVAVPGGTANGTAQVFSGAPSFASGQDYVLFLWTSRSGLTQVIGLSQGQLAVIANASGQPTVVRAAATERMVNAAGQAVPQSDIQMLLSDLRTHIQSVLAKGGGL